MNRINVIAMHPISRTLLVACLACSLSLQAQYTVVFQISQSDILEADAGNDQVVTAGNQLSLGGTPAATGGTDPYSYLWYPGNSLNDSTLSNPDWNPDNTKTFSLTVTDSVGCTAHDSVVITVLTGIDEESHQIYPITLYPNPMTGNLIRFQCAECPPEGLTITIRNIRGQVIDEAQIHPPSWQWSPPSPLPGGSMLLITVQSDVPQHFKVIVP